MPCCSATPSTLTPMPGVRVEVRLRPIPSPAGRQSDAPTAITGGLYSDSAGIPSLHTGCVDQRRRIATARARALTAYACPAHQWPLYRCCAACLETPSPVAIADQVTLLLRAARTVASMSASVCACWTRRTRSALIAACVCSTQWAMTSSVSIMRQLYLPSWHRENTDVL